MSRFHTLRIKSIASETRDAMVVTFDVPEESREAFRFTQGQHVTLRSTFAGEEVRRSYSICSAPFENTLRIAIKQVTDGVFSTWAKKKLQPGDVIEVMEPAGNFHVPLDANVARHHVAFAAGSGITPVLSILKATLMQEPLSRFTLVYGNRASSSVIFKEELEDLKDRYLERFNLIFILSREHQDIELFNGRIDGSKCDQLLQQWIDPADIDVAYLCGPQSMMESVSMSLQAKAVAKEHIKMELFGMVGERAMRIHAPAPAMAKQGCKVTVIQDGRQRDFMAEMNGMTLLDAALEKGVDLPYSCKGGVCSTCRCKMTSGEVDMDINFALEDYEVARGFILTCQSYPLSSDIVLDFDQHS